MGGSHPLAARLVAKTAASSPHGVTTVPAGGGVYGALSLLGGLLWASVLFGAGLAWSGGFGEG